MEDILHDLRETTANIKEFSYTLQSDGSELVMTAERTCRQPQWRRGREPGQPQSDHGEHPGSVEER